MVSTATAGATQSGPRTSLLPLGLVDVTAEPFLADPEGQADATLPIRRAMEEARRRKAAVFFPPGVYLVSDTLEYCFHRAAGRKGQDSPCVLIGSHEGPNRSKLRLASNSPGYQDPKRPKMVIHIWARSIEDAGVAHQNQFGDTRMTPGSVRTQRYRLVNRGAGYELYDMLADPEQKRDIAGRHPELAQRLAAA